MWLPIVKHAATSFLLGRRSPHSPKQGEWLTRSWLHFVCDRPDAALRRPLDSGFDSQLGDSPLAGSRSSRVASH